MKEYTAYEAIQLCITQLENTRLPVGEEQAYISIKGVIANLYAVLEAFDNEKAQADADCGEEVKEDV